MKTITNMLLCLKKFFYEFKNGHPFLLNEEVDIICRTRDEEKYQWMNDKQIQSLIRIRVKEMYKSRFPNANRWAFRNLKVKTMKPQLIILFCLLTTLSFSQAPTKKDSMFCRTIEQERELIKDLIRGDMTDSLLSDCGRENKALTATIASQKEVIALDTRNIELANNQLSQKDIQITAKTTEVEILKNEVKKQKLKSVGIGLGTGASLVLNLVLGVTLLRR